MSTTITGSGISYDSTGTSQTVNHSQYIANIGAEPIGTYAFGQSKGNQVRFNGTIGGSALYTANAGTFGPNNSGYYNRTLAGSWRCMGDCGSANGNPISNWDCTITLFMRYA